MVTLTPSQNVQWFPAVVMAPGSMAGLTISQLWRPSCTLESCITPEKMPSRRTRSQWCSCHGGGGKRHLVERLKNPLRETFPRRREERLQTVRKKQTKIAGESKSLRKAIEFNRRLMGD